MILYGIRVATIPRVGVAKVESYFGQKHNGVDFGSICWPESNSGYSRIMESTRVYTNVYTLLSLGVKAF